MYDNDTVFQTLRDVLDFVSDDIKHRRVICADDGANARMGYRCFDERESDPFVDLRVWHFSTSKLKESAFLKDHPALRELFVRPENRAKIAQFFNSGGLEIPEHDDVALAFEKIRLAVLEK